MPIKHQKKRNIGLVYEFMARYMAKCILDNNNKGLSQSKLLLSKHLNPSTAIHKELKMFNALYESYNFGSREKALNLISKVKKVCESQSQSKIDLEKSAFIMEITNTLKEPEFFNAQISDYKTFATIQVLLNSWRSKNLLESVDTNIVELEEQLIAKLVAPKPVVLAESLKATDMTGDDVDKLVVNLFYDKINKKYAGMLTESQRRLVGYYTTADINILSEVKNISESVLKTLSNYKTEDKQIKDKLQQASAFILENYNLNKVEDITENKMAMFLSIAALKEELEKKA